MGIKIYKTGQQIREDAASDQRLLLKKTREENKKKTEEYSPLWKEYFSKTMPFEQ